MFNIYTSNCTIIMYIIVLLNIILIPALNAAEKINNTCSVDMKIMTLRADIWLSRKLDTREIEVSIFKGLKLENCFLEDFENSLNSSIFMKSKCEKNGTASGDIVEIILSSGKIDMNFVFQKNEKIVSRELSFGSVTGKINNYRC